MRERRASGILVKEEDLHEIPIKHHCYLTASWDETRNREDLKHSVEPLSHLVRMREVEKRSVVMMVDHHDSQLLCMSSLTSSSL